MQSEACLCESQCLFAHLGLMCLGQLWDVRNGLSLTDDSYAALTLQVETVVLGKWLSCILA